MASEDFAVLRMRYLVRKWQGAGDRKAVFLGTYLMMTENMQAALDQDEFNDKEWVQRLLHRFTNYYFAALDAYESEHDSAPLVWQMAMDAAGDAKVSTIQQLLLGVNAHINYDLVLALYDLLGPEWARLDETQRAERLSDHRHVNDVIGRTIDDTQDKILEPGNPLLGILDTVLGPVDNALISRVITGWRENVWKEAVGLLEARGSEDKDVLIRKVMDGAIRMGKLIR